MGVREDVLADPRRRHEGEHHVVFGDAFPVGDDLRALDQVGIREHDALGRAGGAGSKKERRGITARALGDLAFQERRIALVGLAAALEQAVIAREPRLLVMAQAARIVVIDVLEGRTLRQDFEQLVDLLLVLGERVPDLGVADRKGHLRRHRVLIQRDRDRAEALGGSDRRIDTRAVRAHQRHALSARNSVLGERAREVARLLRELLPRPRLPDAEILLADRRPLGPHSRVMHEQLGKRVQRLDALVHRAPPIEAGGFLHNNPWHK